MGVYWKPVNLTRKQYIVPEHCADCGPKLHNWDYPDSPVRQIIENGWSATDVVVYAADSGYATLPDGSDPPVTLTIPTDLYWLGEEIDGVGPKGFTEIRPAPQT